MKFLTCLCVCLCVCVTCPGYPGHHLQLRSIKLAQLHQKTQETAQIARLSNFRKEIFQHLVEFHFPDLKMRDISMAGSSEIWNSSCINDLSVRKIPTQIYCASLRLTVFIPIWSAVIFSLIASLFSPQFYFLPTLFFPFTLFTFRGSLLLLLLLPPPPPMGK